MYMYFVLFCDWAWS